MRMIVRLGWLVAAVVVLPGCGSSATESSSDATWGPLAVAEGPPSGDEALVSGTIEITDECVFLRTGADRSLLVWPSEGTHWNSETETIRYIADGEVELRDGDPFTVGGGGDSEAESGVTDRAWVEAIEWAAKPDEACSTSTREFVGYRPRK